MLGRFVVWYYCLWIVVCLIYDVLRVWLLLTDASLFVCCYYLVYCGLALCWV